MSTKNDEMILHLKKKVDEQKAELAKLPRILQTQTSAIYTHPDTGEKKNIRAMNVEQLTLLRVQLQMYVNACESMDMSVEEFVISDFTLDKWIHDVEGQISVLDRTKKEKKLKETEDTLNRLLSDDKRTELELQKLAEMLG